MTIRKVPDGYREVVAIRASKVMDAYWLSFVDRGIDDVALHLGVTVVPARDFTTAIETAWRTGSNPGGEALGCPVILHRDTFPYSLLCRLLTEPGDIVAAQLALAG